MDSLSLTRSCGGTFFRGLSNPSVLHPLARSRQSEELLRAAFSSAVIGTTVTLSAFYAGRVLFVVPSKDEHTLFSQVLGMLSPLFIRCFHESFTPKQMIPPIMGLPSHG